MKNESLGTREVEVNKLEFKAVQASPFMKEKLLANTS